MEPFLFNQAGKTTAVDGLNADKSIRQDLFFKPSTSTPERTKKYRKSYKDQVGIKQLHYGIYDDPKDYENLVNGVPTKASEHVTDCIKGKNIGGINYFIEEIKEAKYASHNREPLGSSIKRNYEFPQEVKKQEFKFGVPTTGCSILTRLVSQRRNLRQRETARRA